MHVSKPGNTMYFDVDDTLIYWNSSLQNQDVLEAPFKFSFKGQFLVRYAIEANIEELILQKSSGSQIIVWSASGVEWAEAVVKALKIEKFVDAVLTKPTQYYDDKDSKDWMPSKRRHFGPIYKS